MLMTAKYTSHRDNCGSQAEQIKFLLLVLTAASQQFSFYLGYWLWSVNPFTVCNFWRGGRLRYAWVINPGVCFTLGPVGLVSGQPMEHPGRLLFADRPLAGGDNTMALLHFLQFAVWFWHS